MGIALTTILSQIPTFVSMGKKLIEFWNKLRNRKPDNPQPPSYRPRTLGAIIAGLILATALPSLAATTSVVLAWDANTEPELAGYKLYQSLTTSGVFVVSQ